MPSFQLPAVFHFLFERPDINPPFIKLKEEAVARPALACTQCNQLNLSTLTQGNVAHSKQRVSPVQGKGGNYAKKFSRLDTNGKSFLSMFGRKEMHNRKRIVFRSIQSRKMKHSCKKTCAEHVHVSDMKQKGKQFCLGGKNRAVRAEVKTGMQGFSCSA